MSQHDHPHETDIGTRRLGIAVVINLLLTAAQVIGGVMSGSLSLVADALHNFSDAAGLLLALIARRISRRPADAEQTFGYGRAEIVGGLINFTSIMIIAGYLLIEAITRAADRPEIDGWIIVIVAGIAFVVDIATAALTYTLSKDNLNFKAAFLHNLADALASIAVIASGTLIILYDWYWTDIVATIGISIYIVWMSLPPMNRCIRILMQSTPENITIDEVAATIASIDGVKGVGHVHLWPIDESVLSMEVRIAIGDDITARDAALIMDKIGTVVQREHGVNHVTIEVRPESTFSEPRVLEHRSDCDPETAESDILPDPTNPKKRPRR